MRKSILYFLTALTLLAGCKKEEEEEGTVKYEELVRDYYNYDITIDVVNDPNQLVRFEVTWFYPIDKKGDFHFSGKAYDFILSNTQPDADAMADYVDFIGTFQRSHTDEIWVFREGVQGWTFITQNTPTYSYNYLQE